MSIEQLVKLRDKANTLQTAWYRQILTIAAGGLAILSGLNPTVPDGPGKWFLAATWVFLGAGILSGGAATYLEVSRANKLGDSYQEELLRNLGATGRPVVGKIVVAWPSRLFSWSKKMMAVSLSAAVVCLVAYSVSVTLSW